MRRSGGWPPPIFASWNAEWTRRAASAAWASSTTNEMLSSDEPCAMAMTLTRPEARAEKTRAATPGVPAIPRPTTAITATPRRAVTPSTRPAASLLAEGPLEGGRPPGRPRPRAG